MQSKTNSTINCQSILQCMRCEGVVAIPESFGLFTSDEWSRIESLAVHENMPYEAVFIGDAGEHNCVEVGRIMTDVDRPRVVNESVSRPLLEILAAPHRMAFFRELLDASVLHLRRAQINRMHVNSFIGPHVDRDSNPDYEVAVVLQLGRSFEGGDFIVHLPEGHRRVLKPDFRSTSITRCELLHEVASVKAGQRVSLVFFLSRHPGENRRAEPADRRDLRRPGHGGAEFLPVYEPVAGHRHE
ncbi:2OG-Fe(II) oxygenase [Verminephrobacter eiseniae]|uniref:2OG-Fe(II) oxygenase n=1 Tax=Verminephrobacter eiseniae TaxID=364317 RepID=UPI0022376004|nr:2OG-Fe(II) oxygenase [Verminephrobacter eiseniae]MCW5234849.1 2OG-Fe(II) oxygenase [Verminephrobacter eiseniae]